MNKGNLQYAIYRNSGINQKQFYTQHFLTRKEDWRADYYGLDEDIDEEVVKLASEIKIYAKAWKIPINKVEDLFFKRLNVVCDEKFCFIPEKSNVKTALLCGLIPFWDLDLGGMQRSGVACDDNQIVRFDAYQVLVDGTIDAKSEFFTKQEYYEEILGKELVEKMNKILNEEK